MLKEIAADIEPVPNHTRHKWARWDAYISAAEPETLFGLRGFEVTEADGYVLFFGRPRS